MKKYFVAVMLVLLLALPAVVLAATGGVGSATVTLAGKWNIYGQEVNGYITVARSGKVTGGHITLRGGSTSGDFTISGGQLCYISQTGNVSGKLVESTEGLTAELKGTLLHLGDMIVGTMDPFFGSSQQMAIFVKESPKLLQ